MVEALTAPSYLVKCTSLLIKANDFFHEIKCNRKTSLTECMYSPSIGVTHCFFPWSFIIVKIRHCHASNTTSSIFSFIMEIFSYWTNEKKKYWGIVHVCVMVPVWSFILVGQPWLDYTYITTFSIAANAHVSHQMSTKASQVCSAGLISLLGFLTKQENDKRHNHACFHLDFSE